MKWLLMLSFIIFLGVALAGKMIWDRSYGPSRPLEALGMCAVGLLGLLGTVLAGIVGFFF
ncbi:hypothetical protein [Herbaspirillum sp. ST 5-3]|uniref:hypothetical protein n=1 Tax=Oxalobacteraceae TaxID=75682 RepID=UPI0010A32FC5|nr:hypothetical protein [Herbaspirillum sp. ST 5-3]